jgi:hypothetical protein
VRLISAETCLIRRLQGGTRCRAGSHRVYAAYALAQLEAGRSERSGGGWPKGREESIGDAFAGWPSRACSLSVTSTVWALLPCPGTVRTFATFEVGHLNVMRRLYHLAHERPMRIAVTKESFRR